MCQQPTISFGFPPTLKDIMKIFPSLNTLGGYVKVYLWLFFATYIYFLQNL